MPHLVFIPFLFVLGSCVGSFLNVVVWRLPRGESLSHPGSHCPKCNNPLKWYDNIPIIGWLKLHGKCRFCRQPISPRYPIVEAVTGLLFVFYYVMFFMLQVGPCAARPIMVEHETLGALKMLVSPLTFANDWPIYLLYMAMIGGLLAASLIDAELFIIPIEIPWVLAVLGLATHAIVDKPALAGALNLHHEPAALAAGGAVGLLISLGLWLIGRMPVSFPDGEPMQDVSEPLAPDQPPPRKWTSREIRREMRKEMLFLLPPMLLAAVCWLLASHVAPVHQWWMQVTAHNWVSGLLGSIFGALVGGFVVWIFRILGTIVFGRLAMGLGDVHLMFGVGAIIGAGGATIAFFIAPFFGIAIAIYMLLTGSRRELPYGPYLSLATACVLLFYCPLADWLNPGMSGLAMMLRQLTGL